jgi:hypothetical protein
MIKERYYILRDKLISSVLIPPYKTDKLSGGNMAWSEDNDISQSTRIRTSTDIETKEGTINNDG